MTNAELLLALDEVNNLDNICDQIIALKKMDKEYRNSDFFKITKMPLNLLAKEYQMKKFFTFDSLLSGLQKIINNLDATQLTNVIDHFSDVSRADFEKIMDDTKGAGLAEIVNYFKQVK